MGSFTKKRLKTSKELKKDISKGDLSLIKKEFSIEETVATVKLVTETAVELKGKVNELKQVHNELFQKNNDSLS
jgi:hypothetical protein